MTTSTRQDFTLHRSLIRLGRIWWRPTGETLEALIPGMDPGVWIELPLAVFDELGEDLRRSPWSDKRESEHGLYIHAYVNLAAENYGEIEIQGPFEIPPEPDWDKWDEL